MNRIKLLLLFVLVLAGCREKSPGLSQVSCRHGRAHAWVDQLHLSRHPSPPPTDTVLNDEHELILHHHSPDWVDVERRFKPRKTFEDYPVNEKFTGKIPSKLNFSTCSVGALYKTNTTLAVQLGARFAGHYAFAEMGCGCPCQVGFIVDLKNGNVYSCPDAICGYEYRIGSRILVVNPPDSNNLYSALLVYDCVPRQYLWTGSAFKRLE